MNTGSRTAALVGFMTIMAAVAFSAVISTLSLASAVPVLTYHYNKARTGTNKSETILTPDNVNVRHFGKLFSIPVDAGILAQPLYVPNLPIPGLGTHNVIYEVTQHNSVYAFDANNGATLGVVNTGPYHAVISNCVPQSQGIIGTAAIDPSSNTIYFDAATARKGNDS
jgi:hypothetical protein